MPDLRGLGHEAAIDTQSHQHRCRFHAAGKVVGDDADDGLHVPPVTPELLCKDDT